MRSSTLCQTLRRGFRVLRSPAISRTLIRNSSTGSSLRQQLTARPPTIIYDYLSPTPSHLLNISLADFLPESCFPPEFKTSDLALPLSNRAVLPQGHHLIYFAPQVPSSSLLPDGTDPLQSPGPPFVRRMWAGGSLLFNKSPVRQLQLDTTRAACIERISDVSVKGVESGEKVFVNIERHIGPVGPKSVDPEWEDGEENPGDDELLLQYDLQAGEGSDRLGHLSLIETRNIVFMRDKSEAVAEKEAVKPEKILKRM